MIFDVVVDRFTDERKAARVRLSNAARVGAGGGGAAGSAGDAVAPSLPDKGTDASGRELGRVEKLTHSYGFIRKIGGGGAGGGGRASPSLFFHYSALERGCFEDDLAIGLPVRFTRASDGRAGKPTASRVAFAKDEEPLARELEKEEREAASAARRAAPNPSDGDRWGKAADSNSSNARGGASDADLAAAAAAAAADDDHEYGVVAQMKASYGFIRCCDRANDLFFHFTDVRGG